MPWCACPEKNFLANDVLLSIRPAVFFKKRKMLRHAWKQRRVLGLQRGEGGGKGEVFDAEFVCFPKGGRDEVKRNT